MSKLSLAIPEMVMLGLDDVVAAGQLVERIIFGALFRICKEGIDSRTPATAALLMGPFEERLLDVEGVLHPLFLTFVRTMKRQIFGLPRTRRECVYEPTSEPKVTRSNP